MSFLNSIKDKSKKHEFPFDHWEYHNALTDGAIEEIAFDYSFILKMTKKI